MNQPDFATIRLYSKIRRSLHNMLNDQDMAVMWPCLFSRLSATKVDLELCYPGIDKIAPEDPRILEDEGCFENEGKSEISVF